MGNKTIAWFSCGATSAVACKIALGIYENVEIYYIDTGSGHEDNERFISDCEKWFGQPILRLKNKKYKDHFDCIEKTRYVNGPSGAACTKLLKKEVRFQLEKELGEWSGQVWGFEFDLKEINRSIRFNEQYPETKPLFPLIERQITKQDALGMLWKAGIKIPVMYEQGYNNNNCIGCPKGGIGYWNKIRRDYPSHYKEMARIERVINASCLKDKNGRIFLDELDPNRGNDVEAIVPDCSIICQIEFQEIIDKRAMDVFSGKMKITDVA